MNRSQLAVIGTTVALCGGGGYALANQPPRAGAASDASIVKALNRVDADIRASQKDLHNTLVDTCRAIAQSPGDCPFRSS